MSAVLNGVYINGAWCAGQDVLEVINPATEQALAQVSVGDARAVTQAVNAASAAFAGWSKSTGGDRAALLRKVAQGVSEQREQLMQWQSSNNGKPLFEAGIDVDDVIATFEYYAGVCDALDAGQDSPVTLPSDAFSARLRREPYGVVGLIVPWNFPMVTTAWKLAPALAAGCCVVLKPSEVTPLAELQLARIIADAGFPAGVFNLVCGTGPAVGAPLAADRRVAKISFTGSNAVGGAGDATRRRNHQGREPGIGRQILAVGVGGGRPGAGGGAGLRRWVFQRRANVFPPPAACWWRTAWRTNSCNACRHGLKGFAWQTRLPMAWKWAR